MLTPDLVHARRQKDELKLVGLGARREHALELAEIVVELAKEHVGRPREELEAAWQSIEVEPRDRKLLDGVIKLVDDGLQFDSETGEDAPALRSEVFQRAAAARRALGEGESFDRAGLLREIASARGMDQDALERALYGDLRGAHLLREVRTPGAKALIEGYDLAQAQAVLLRATRVVALLEGIEPAAMRALLRKLKFLRLLHTVRDEGGGRWRLEIDGPFSLFESVTKYGLALALALPAIVSCGRHRVVADVRWGKERLPLRFVVEGDAPGRDEIPARLGDEAEALRARIEERGGAWSAEPADAILDLPGVGACVPDLVCTHRETGSRVFVEVMGYWSRDAVWKRVELAEKGLGERVLFCVSERLRVSEAVLPDDAPAALLVFKGVIPIGAFLEKLERLRASGG